MPGLTTRFQAMWQLDWGCKLLKKRRWIGNEIVMDAGVESGNLPYEDSG